MGNVLKFHEKHCEPREMKVKEGRSEMSPSKIMSTRVNFSSDGNRRKLSYTSEFVPKKYLSLLLEVDLIIKTYLTARNYDTFT